MILIIDSLFYRLWSDGRREKVTRCLAERDWCAVRAVTQAWRPKLMTILRPPSLISPSLAVVTAPSSTQTKIFATKGGMVGFFVCTAARAVRE